MTGSVGRRREVVAVILGDGVPMLEAAVPARVFGMEPRPKGSVGHTVLAVSETGRPVTTTAGIELHAPHRLDAVDRAGIVVVPGWRDPGSRSPADPAVVAALRRAHAEGAIIVGLCLGSFVLARAGLLDGLRATTHWHFTGELARRYPRVRVDADVLYVDEGQVLTSAGSAAGIDACLHLLRREYGPHAATAVARALVVAPHRAGGQAQFVEHAVPAAATGDVLSDTMAYAMTRLPDDALDVDELARHARMSRRTFDRRWRATTGCSPLQWLLTQRVLLAQRLLESTGLTVDAVARRSGFADAVALRPHFRRVVHVSPQAYRDTYQGR